MTFDIDIPSTLERLGITETTRQARGELWAPCPFPDHRETRPSFQVRDEPGTPKHGFYSCHGCKRAGGIVGLVAALFNCEMSEARRWLLDEGLRREDVRPFSTIISTSLYGRTPFRLPPEVRLEPFESWTSPARRYLEGRGIDALQADGWGLGYAVSGKLAHRIVIPKRDHTGKPRSYTARTFISSEHRRYLEPSKEDGADSGVVFGEQFWPSVDKRHRVVVCEGAFDALAVERVLRDSDIVSHVAALSGSQIAPVQIAKLATFGLIVVLTDSDKAGDKAALQLVTNLGRCEYIRVRLPEGFDANALERNDPWQLRARIECPAEFSDGSATQSR